MRQENSFTWNTKIRRSLTFHVEHNQLGSCITEPLLVEVSAAKVPFLHHNQATAQRLNQGVGCAPGQRRREGFRRLSPGVSEQEQLAVWFDKRLQAHQNPGLYAHCAN